VTPERWERIEALYHDAEALPPDRRDEFLAEACGNDHDLRRDVASLLDEPVSPGGFLSQPAILRAAHMLGDAPAASMTGRSVGRYQLHALIGAGGMGEVYHSHDATLARDVAVKILPPAFINDSDRLARLEREARMLAAVNHPNICAIYGVEEANGIRFLLLELVEGDTLADRLVQAASPVAAGLPLPEVLNIARQLADALEAAHDKGIIHRDLKPANIKITPQGVVKVLDFGLAKSLAAGSAPDITHVPDGKMGHEADGAVVGTAAYMSPEQARGSRVDSRTDIWAFGCVLFEMLTGRLPFAGGTASDTIAKILEREPDWTALPAETPAAIRRVLLRCLVKDHKKRIRDIGDVRLEIDAVDEVLPAVVTATSTVRRRSSALSWLPYLGMAALATAFGLVEWRRPAIQDNPLDPSVSTIRKLTDWEGSEGAAAISPDGKFVAFLADKDGEVDVWVTQIGAHKPVNVTLDVPPLDPPTMLRTLGFTGGGEIWFTPPSAGGPAGQKMLVPVTGGPGRPLLGSTAATPAWSWDGSHLAYFENDEGDPMYVADGAAADPINVVPPSRDWPHNHHPTWSFDDLWIYFTRGHVYGLNETDEMDIWRIRPAGGPPERMTTANTDITSLTALDARTLLYVGRSENREGPWLWSLDTVTKARRRISSGLERYTSVAASHDGQRIVATIANPTSRLWSVPLDRPAGSQDVKGYDVPSAQAFAPRFGGDALFYLSSNGGADGLFRMQGTSSSQIWSGGDGTLSEPPSISRDGKRVALIVRREGKQHLSVMLADGTGRRAIAPSIDTQGTSDWSPDGSWIVTGGSDRDGPGLFKIPVDGGDPKRLASVRATNPIWSSDGSLIVYGAPLVAGQVPLMAVQPDGSPVVLPKLTTYPGGYRFMPSGRQIVYLPRVRLRTFWMLDLDTNTTRELTHVGDAGRLRTFDITPDGKQLVFDLLHQNSDVVLIERRGR
jgi:serine/threonine protein kinase/Tol biopolymer transport system component